MLNVAMEYRKVVDDTTANKSVKLRQYELDDKDTLQLDEDEVLHGIDLTVAYLQQSSRDALAISRRFPDHDQIAKYTDYFEKAPSWPDRQFHDFGK